MKHQVLDNIKGYCLVGHDIRGDLQRFLQFDEVPSTLKGVWDTAYCGSLRERVHWEGAGLPSLSMLSKTLLAHPIQQDTHSALEDARATLKLFQLGDGQTSFFDNWWEGNIRRRGRNDRKREREREERARGMRKNRGI